MKDVLAYVAGGLLVGYVGYIFVSPDEPTRVNRACIPAASATRLLGTVVGMVDQESGDSLMHGKPYEVLASCRRAVWYWHKNTRDMPKFPEEDALFGSYAPKSTAPAAPPQPATESGKPAQPQAKKAAASSAAASASAATKAPTPEDEDRL